MNERLCTFRRELHQIPEVDFDLTETVAYVKRALEGLSCGVFSPARASVCAWFDAGKAETIAFRADMDALPVEEQGGKPYRSAHPGKMHACGHDAHTAMLLELAHRLDERREELRYNVLLIFQPAEETGGGADGICESGVLEQYGVKYIFGIHLWPKLPAGTLWTKPGPLMAKNSEIDLVFTGKSAHITRPDLGIDALWIAAEFLRRAYEMEKNEVPASERRMLRFGMLESGTVRNAISAKSVLRGTVRVFSMEVYAFIRRRVEEICADLEREYGCSVAVSFSPGNMPVSNDPALVALVERQLGNTAPCRLEEGTMVAEDFSSYQQRVPGVFCFLGVGDTPALHASDFDFDESALESGVAFFENLLKRL